MNKLFLILLLALPVVAQDNGELVASLDKLLDGKALITYYYVPSSAQSIFINIPLDKKDKNRAETIVKDAQTKVLAFLKPKEPTYLMVMASREKRPYIPHGSECIVTQTPSHLSYSGTTTITSFYFRNYSYVRISGGLEHTGGYTTSTCYPLIEPLASLDWSNMPLNLN